MACETIFVPKIDACLYNTCNTICIKELTDVQQLPYNPEGWSSNTVETSDIVTATVTFKDYTDTTVLETYILKDTLIDLYPTTFVRPSPFIIEKDSNGDSFVWGQADGVFKIIYTIDTATDTYTNQTQYVFFICNINNCINSLIQKIVKECNSEKLTKMKTMLDQLEIIVYGIKGAFSNRDFETSISLIASAKTICENICDCSCK